MCRPKITAALTAFALSGAGDVLGQYAEHGRHYDLKRTLAQACFSATYASQVYVPWVRLLDKHIGGALTVRVGLVKASLDLLLLCPCLGLPSYYVWTSLAAGHTYGETVDRVKSNYADTLTGSWLVWAPIQVCTYSVVPAPFRVAFMYSGELAWGTMASYTSSRPLPSMHTIWTLNQQPSEMLHLKGSDLQAETQQWVRDQVDCQRTGVLGGASANTMHLPSALSRTSHAIKCHVEEEHSSRLQRWVFTAMITSFFFLSTNYYQ